MTLRACSQCRRHFAAEAVCPFCGTAAPPVPQRPRLGGRLSRAAVFASVTLVGCYTSNPPPQQYGPPPPPPPHEEPQHFSDPPPPRPTSGGSISGVVRDSRNTTPMPNVSVQLMSNAQPPTIEPQATQTDANGRYSFANLPAGTYLIVYGNANPRSRQRPQQLVFIADHEAKALDLQIYSPPPSNIPMPYGAPPARARVV
ncbi:MAG TPA: carboxypeptidase-like regulatory domain-containing protein [Kofleriaceae bacterium]